MASASSKRTLDTDNIKLRKVFIKASDNSRIPLNYVLTSVGDGSTYWADPSTLGSLPTFSEVLFDSNIFKATPVSRSLQLRASDGIGLSTTVSSISLQVFSKNFSQIDISGSQSLFAFSNFVLNNSFLVASQGFISTSTDPLTNTVTIVSLRDAPALSTNIISFQSLKIISSLAEPTDTSVNPGSMILSRQAIDTIPVFAGTNDFLLRSLYIPPIIGLELSSYSAHEFLTLSTLIATSFVSTLSSISSVFTQKDIFSTAFISLSTTEFTNTLSNTSTLFGVSNYTQLTYDQKVGDTLARATIIQVNDQFGTLNSGVSTISTFKTPLYVMLSTNQGFINSFSTPGSLEISTFTNFTAGSIFDFTVTGLIAVSTQLSTLSTSIGSNVTTMSNGFNEKIPPFLTSTLSTFQQLGSIGYVSSQSLQSTVRSLGSEGYISSFQSTLNGLQFILPSSQTIIQSIQSTTTFIITTAPYISSLTLQSTVVSTTGGIINSLGQQYISSAGLSRAIVSTGKGIIDHAAFNSYISSATFISTLVSTVSSLNILYPTTLLFQSTLLSTVSGAPFVSEDQLRSTTNGLNTLGFLRVTDLQSTTDSFLNRTKLFVSSLRIPSGQLQQVIPMTNIFEGSNASLSNQYFSSIRYPSLSNFSKQFVNATDVHIQYTPTILFSVIRSTSNGTYLFPISTGIQIGPTFIPATLFEETIALNANGTQFDYTGSSNLYSRQFHFQLKKSEFLTAESNGFAIVHILQNSNQAGFPDNYFILNTQAGIFTSPTNSLFISIYN